MYKNIPFSSKYEECTVDKIEDKSSLEKVAAPKISDEIEQFIEENIKKDPQYVYVLVTALGAGEIWGANVNGDYFEEDVIKEHHKTFEEYGHVFTHHKNKDPEKSKGDIMFSHFNPRMHRVELVVRLDREKAPKICNDIDNGKMWDVSMGCKVPYDVCSICGNVAKTTHDYCEHIDNHCGEVLDDGRKVYMINKKPRFFDISFVYIGADRIAKSLKKVASRLGTTPEELEKKIGNNEGEYLNKAADMIKELPGDVASTNSKDIASTITNGLMELKRREPAFPRKVLDKYCDFGVGRVLKSLLSLGIAMKPEELKYLLMKSKEPLRVDGDLDIKIVRSAIPMMKHRSGFKRFLYPRIIEALNHKPQEVNFRNEEPYNDYLKKIPKKINFSEPWLSEILKAGTVGRKPFSGITKTYLTDQFFDEENWNDFEKGIKIIPDDILTKTAAELMGPEQSQDELIRQTKNLYEKYQGLDNKYNKLNQAGNLMINAQSPTHLAGSFMDSIAGKGISKLLGGA